jgi:hypothetical protein
MKVLVKEEKLHQQELIAETNARLPQFFQVRLPLGR